MNKCDSHGKSIYVDLKSYRKALNETITGYRFVFVVGHPKEASSCRVCR